MFRMLHSQLPQPNAGFPTDSPHLALYSGSVKEVDGLLERGAIVRATHNLGESPLLVAMTTDRRQND
jgi:hypothetical protein